MNLFEPAAAEEILSRMEGIKAATPPAWGKMNTAQMMAHCQAPFKAYFGEIKMKRGLVGILFGVQAGRLLLTSTTCFYCSLSSRPI